VFNEDEQPQVKPGDPQKDSNVKSEPLKKEEKKESTIIQDDQPKKIELKYPLLAHVFQNTIVPYDFYMIHEGATNFLRLKILNEFKKVLTNEVVDLADNFENVQNSCKLFSETISNHIYMNEFYAFILNNKQRNDKIFPMSYSSVEVKQENN